MDNVWVDFSVKFFFVGSVWALALYVHFIKCPQCKRKAIASHKQTCCGECIPF
jgi:hypothetical protein